MIAAEGGDVASIYTGWVMILAAIPAVASFIGMTLFGIGGFGITIRVPIFAALLNMVMGYVLTLVMVFVLALIVEALAPTFGGTKDRIAALKVVAYSFTAVWVAGVLSIVPALGALGGLIGLIWTDLPPLHRAAAADAGTPADKAGAYTAVVIVCGIIAAVVIGAVSSLFMSGSMASASAMGSDVGRRRRRHHDQGRRRKQRHHRRPGHGRHGQARGGSRQAHGIGAEVGRRRGGGQGDGRHPRRGDRHRRHGAASIRRRSRRCCPSRSATSSATRSRPSRARPWASAAPRPRPATRRASKRVELSITDTGGLAGLATMAGWANMTMDKETDGKIEKVYKDGARTVREEYRKDGSSGEMTVILANGVIVEADGTGVDIGALKKVDRRHRHRQARVDEAHRQVTPTATQEDRTSMNTRFVFRPPLAASPSRCRPAAHRTDAASTLDKIKQSGTMTLAYRESSIPFSYLGGDAQPTGFGFEICEKIAEKVKAATGRADMKKAYQSVTSANRIPLLQNGTIDIECGSTTNNSERGKQVQFATNYFYTGTRFLVKTGTSANKLGRPGRQARGLDDRHHQLPDHPAPERRTEARHRPAGRERPRRIGADGAERPRRRLRDGRHPALRPEGQLAEPCRARRGGRGDPGRALRDHGARDDPAFKKLVDDTIAGLMKSGEFEALYKKWFQSPIPPKGINLNAPMSKELVDNLKNLSDKPAT